LSSPHSLHRGYLADHRGYPSRGAGCRVCFPRGICMGLLWVCLKSSRISMVRHLADHRGYPSRGAGCLLGSLGPFWVEYMGGNDRFLVFPFPSLFLHRNGRAGSARTRVCLEIQHTRKELGLGNDGILYFLFLPCFCIGMAVRVQPARGFAWKFNTPGRK